MLSVSDVHSSYGRAPVLRGTSLRINHGEVVGLLGRNGRGKTTLVRTIAGMTPPRLRRGTVRLGGEEISGLPSHVVARRGVGLVPQGRGVFASLTVEENLTVTARTGPGGTEWTLPAAYELFPRLAQRRFSLGGNLSGGEQQMLAIARALLTNPVLLVMDEPSEGLAPAVIEQLRERLATLAGTGLSILLVEQNLGLALGLSDRVYVLGDRGEVAWTGLPDELAADPETQRRHLGVSTREVL
jgi:branched-chain amino acid transport system ATP-binding protein